MGKDMVCILLETLTKNYVVWRFLYEVLWQKTYQTLKFGKFFDFSRRFLMFMKFFKNFSTNSDGPRWHFFKKLKIFKIFRNVRIRHEKSKNVKIQRLRCFSSLNIIFDAPGRSHRRSRGFYVNINDCDL